MTGFKEKSFFNNQADRKSLTLNILERLGDVTLQTQRLDFLRSFLFHPLKFISAEGCGKRERSDTNFNDLFSGFLV